MSATPQFTTYARVVQHLGLAPRVQQANLVAALGRVATAPVGGHAVIQAGTGVGKSIATLSVAASIGKPGAPAVILTVTNALSTQYIEKDAPAVQQATGMTFARVMGGSHYICADSPAAEAACIPGFGAIEYDQVNGTDNSGDIRQMREEWLNQVTDPANGYATEYERTWHGDDYQCPGFPECDGSTLGGCGKRIARARAWDVDVVVSNFHVAAFQVLFAKQAKMLPLDVAKMVLVDEAHAMPDILATVLTTSIGPQWGTRSKIPASLVDLVHTLRGRLIADVQDRWSGRYHTAERVALTTEDAQQLLDAVDQATAAGLKDRSATDEDPESAGTLATLRRWARLTLDRKAAGIATCVVAYRDTDRDHDPHTLYLEVVEAAHIARQILGDRAALVSGTVPRSLPRRVGLDNVIPTDVGHPFDYAGSVTGWISSVEGVKAKRAKEAPGLHEWRTRTRIAELDAFIGEGSALVLCSAHDDVTLLERLLVPQLIVRGLRVFLQPRTGGSKAAMDVANQFKAYGPGAVLIGTASYATGLDCPGATLTKVALWSLPIGAQDHPVDKVRQGWYGTYFSDRTRTLVTQSVGRLLRRTTDRGSVYLADSRFVQHLRGATGVMDRHLGDITWTVLSTTPAAQNRRGA